MIQLVHLTKFYKSKENVAIGLQDINLEFQKGEFVVIVGPSGSGKTTLLNVISGMDTYEEGELLLNGVPTSNYSLEDFENYRRANVAFIFQNYQLIDSYTVLENVMVELIFKGFKKKEAKNKAKEILQKVGMGHRLKNRATKLSGGEKQRVVIARALASDAQILVCDEPTGNLDTHNSLEIMKLLKEVAKDKLILLVTHDEGLIQDNATRVIRIKDGHIEEDSTLQETSRQDTSMITPIPNKWSTQLYIACKNILRTPKKSLFIFFVFLILSFVIIFSIAYIPTDVVAKESKTIDYDLFKNKEENRIISYLSEESNEFPNLSNLTICENDYLVDATFRLATTEEDLNKYIKKTSQILISDFTLNLIHGQMPESNEEILLVINQELSESFLQKTMGATIYLGAQTGNLFREHTYTVVGIAKQKNPIKDRTDFYLSRSGREILFDMVKNNQFYNIRESFISDFSLQSEGVTNPIELINTNTESIFVNYTYKNRDFSICLGNRKLDLSKYSVEYMYSAEPNFHARISTSIAKKLLEEVPYRFSVYVSSEDVDNTIHMLEDTYQATCFSIKDSNRIEQVYDITSILERLFYFIFIFVEVLLCLFISSLITSFVLGTKKRELGVLRVIGLSEKDVLHVLQFELLLMMLISIGITIGILGISLAFPWEFSLEFIFLNPVKLLFSCVVLFVMAFIISFKWNKKMFKRSAREVLKVGENL